jgi:hypothetical protein
MTHLTALSLERLASGNPRTWGPVAEAACGAKVNWVDGRTTELIRCAYHAADITPEMLPTCPRCAVLLDAALESPHSHPQFPPMKDKIIEVLRADNSGLWADTVADRSGLPVEDVAEWLDDNLLCKFGEETLIGCYGFFWLDIVENVR